MSPESNRSRPLTQRRSVLFPDPLGPQTTTTSPAETDSDIRESAKRVLPAERVDGDRECVPPLAEVVERVVGQVAALRADAEALVRAVADYFDFGERQLLKDARNKMNRTLDVARAAKQ